LLLPALQTSKDSSAPTLPTFEVAAAANYFPACFFNVHFITVLILNIFAL
jgi:hypothetical protein